MALHTPRPAPGKVCVWLDYCPAERDDPLIGGYDHDQSEGGAAKDLATGLSSGSYTSSFAPAALRAARALGVEAVEYVFCLYDVALDHPAGPFGEGTFLGVFDYSPEPGEGDRELALSASPQLRRLVEGKWKRKRTFHVQGVALAAAGAALLAEAEGLERMHTLELVGTQLGCAGAKALAASPHTGGLKTLNLTANGIGDPGLRALAASPGFSAVRELRLSSNALTGEGLAAIGPGSSLAGVVRLDVESNHTADPAVEDAEVAMGLARSAMRLETLKIDNCQASDPGLAALLQAPVGSGLSELDAGGSRLGDRTLAALGRCHRLRRLRLHDAKHTTQAGWEELCRAARLLDLDLSWCALGDAGAEILAEGLPRLRRLVLTSAGLGEAGVVALSDAAWLGLSELDLSYNHLGERGVEALASSEVAFGLRALRLWHADGVSLGSVEALASSERLAGLEELELHAWPLGDEGARLLAASPHLTHLRVLSLRDCRIGPQGARALAEAPELSRLGRIVLAGNPIGPGDKARLQARFDEVW